jgi:GT2 family glycosyltransferase
MSDIAIVIVTYNSADHIGGCLDAALPTGADVVVVDNASSDSTVSKSTERGARVIANSRNAGFAAAVNQGFRATTAAYVLVLNPDATILAGLECLQAACESPGAAGAGGKLLGEDGQPQIGFMARALPTPGSLIMEALLVNRIWPSNPTNRRYRCMDLNYSKSLQIEQPAGAFLMIRRDVWQELDGLDERFYPLWFEDVDFCRRAIDAGRRFYFVPDAVARHTGGHSIPKISPDLRAVYWYGSFLRYTVKHFRPAAARWVCASVILGSIVRMAVESIRLRSLKPVAGYARVLRQAGSLFLSPALEAQ